jgi:hypothetical protein
LKIFARQDSLLIRGKLAEVMEYLRLWSLSHRGKTLYEFLEELSQ